MNKKRNQIQDSQIAAPDPTSVGATIAALRRQRHLSQIELGRRIGMLAPPLNNIERGRNLPSTPVLHRIATVLGVPVDAILHPDHLSAYFVKKPVRSLSVVAETGPYSIKGMEGVGITRALDETPSADAEMIQQVGTLSSACLALETLCQISSRSELPLLLMFEPTSSGTGRLAGQVRRLLGVDGPSVMDLAGWLEYHGLRIVSCVLPESWQSLSCFDSSHGNAMILVSRELTVPQRNERLAYELGRLYGYTQWHCGNAGVPDSGPDGLDPHALATVFTASFLLSEMSVCRWIHHCGVEPTEWNMAFLVHASSRMGVTPGLLCDRLRSLDLLPAANADRFMKGMQRRKRQTSNSGVGADGSLINRRLGDLYAAAEIRARSARNRDALKRLRAAFDQFGVVWS